MDLSDAISPQGIRPDTAKKLITSETLSTLESLMYMLQLPSAIGPLPITAEAPRFKKEVGKKKKGGKKKFKRTFPSDSHFPEPVTPPKEITPSKGITSGLRPLSFGERFEIVKNGVNKIMMELDQAIKKSLKDNAVEKNIQRVFSIVLFTSGLILILAGFLLNQFAISVIGAIPEFLIIWPYKNLTKIKDENMFLWSLVPWVKVHLISCEMEKNEKDIMDCYAKGLRLLDSWMGKLQKNAYFHR